MHLGFLSSLLKKKFPRKRFWEIIFSFSASASSLSAAEPPPSSAPHELLHALEANLQQLGANLAAQTAEKAESRALTEALASADTRFEVKREGQGQSVQAYNHPILRFSGRFLNGQTFCDSHGETALPLQEILPCLREGIVGMKEGEIRLVYVHPHNSSTTLLFEVELIQAEGSVEEEDINTTPLPKFLFLQQNI
jgi:FKBP-type peptidyl-prolyl cis-trans isomerase